ncbi:cytochrome P450 [Diaporthe eres]|nr:cytochrome P450 [Diaporthe eres]
MDFHTFPLSLSHPVTSSQSKHPLQRNSNRSPTTQPPTKENTYSHQPNPPASLERIALKPFTFTNGLHLPEGTWIGTPHSPLFQGEAYYPNPSDFDPRRHARMRDSPDPQVRRQSPITATSDHSMHFGHGRHTCPGRHMASDEVKLVMAHLLLSYDFALFGPRPENMRLLKFNVPNMTARIWLRQRKQCRKQSG